MVQNRSWEWLLQGFKFDLETQLKPTTVEYYHYHARLFARWALNTGQIADPGLVTKRDVQLFLHHLINSPDTIGLGNGTPRRVQRTERTRWHYYRSLRRFFEWAKSEGYLKRNPVEDIRLKAPKEPPIEPYRPEHVDLMLEVLDHDFQIATTERQRMLAARDRAILLLLLESGLRLGELAVLKAGDVDLERQRVLVWGGKMGKGRLAGFGTQTKKALWRYMGMRPLEVQGDALWVTEEGRPLSKHGVQEVIRRLKRDAGLEHVKGSVHKFRHTFATTYLRHTRDMKGARLLLGHSTLGMVERYTQFIDVEDALKAYNGKGPLDWLKE